jgi:hypothetical protein
LNLSAEGENSYTKWPKLRVFLRFSTPLFKKKKLSHSYKKIKHRKEINMLI